MTHQLSSTEESKLFLLEKGNAAFVQGRAKWTSQKRRAAIQLSAASLFCILVGLFLTSDYAIGTRLVRQLQSHGQRAEATILSKRIAGEDRDEYYVAYRFKTNSNDVVNKEGRVSRRMFERMDVGSVQFVVYAPQNPQLCVLQGAMGNATKNAAFVAGWWLITMVVLLYLATNLRVQHLFSSKGILLTGSLNNVLRTEGDVESPSKAELAYMFRAPSGKSIQGKAEGLASRSNLSDLRRADLSRNEYHRASVAVLYIADDRYLLL